MLIGSPLAPARFAMGIAALLLLAGSGDATQASARKVAAKAATTAPAGRPAAALAKRSRSVSPAMLQRAFKAVFGKPSPLIEEGTYAGVPGSIEAEKLIWLGDTAILITSATYEYAPEAAYGSLGIYYLKTAGAGFIVTGKWPEATWGFRSGIPPWNWLVTRRFGPLPMLYSEGGYQGDGVTCSDFDLIELAPDGPEKVAAVQFHFDDEDAREDGENVTAIDGRITRIVPGKSFTIHYTGTRTFTETWERHGDEYVLRGKTRMKLC